MFTNEFDWDETVTTILDDEGRYEDIQVFIDDSEVYIRQWNEKQQVHDLIVMSSHMYFELMAAMKKPEGAYYVERSWK